MAESSEFVLGVDLDGVCADFYAHMRIIVAEWRGVDVNSLPLDVTYGLHEWGVPDTEEYLRIHRFAVTERGLFRSVPLIDGARQALRRLSNDGFHVRIITHRLFVPYFHRQAVEQTVAWLDSRAIPYRDLCFMEDKCLVDADVYIEDNPRNIEAIQNAGKTVIAFTNSTNAHMDPPPTLRASNWTETEQKIRELRERPRPRQAVPVARAG